MPAGRRNLTARMTDRARKVLLLASDEAWRRGSPTLEPEHILLGLARERHGVATHVLKSLGVSAENIAEQLPAEVTGLSARISRFSPRIRLPWSPATELVIANSHAEAAALTHNYVGTEHLILAIASWQEGAVPAMLPQLGITADEIRVEVYELLGHGS